MPIQTRQTDVAVRGGQEVFRLFQQIQSAGDIFELNASAKAICIGPQSDLSSYRVDFFDTQAPDRIDEINLAIGNPIIGRLDAKLATQYPGTSLPANILVTARDIVDNTFLPTTFVPAENDFVAARPIPNIDILQYLDEPSALAPMRDDRVYFFPFISTGVPPQDAFYILPYYGRRYCHINLVNRNAGVTTYTATVLGINLSAGTTTTAPVGRNKAGETALGVLSAASLATDNLIIDASDGLFDLISIQLANSVGLFDPDSTLRITVSDRTP